MPRLIYTENAIRDLKRVHDFLQDKNPQAASRARDVILAALNSLTDYPAANRPVEEIPNQRELVIKFGAGGYVARYHYESDADVIILFIKHQRELGYTVD
jgi:plasmid stabilization system protein ParE